MTDDVIADLCDELRSEKTEAALVFLIQKDTGGYYISRVDTGVGETDSKALRELRDELDRESLELLFHPRRLVVSDT